MLVNLINMTIYLVKVKLFYISGFVLFVWFVRVC